MWVSWQKVTICLHRSRLWGTYIFPQNWSRPSMFNHSEEYTIPLAECRSSCAALVMGSSWSPFWFSLHMLDKIFCSTPVSSTPSKARTARNSGQRRTMLSLSEAPFPWSAFLDSASGLPIVCPGQWWSKKSNLARCKDQRAWRRLSFLAVMKYSRFLWSVQISTRWVAPSKKCLYSSNARIMASISLLWISPYG